MEKNFNQLTIKQKIGRVKNMNTNKMETVIKGYMELKS